MNSVLGYRFRYDWRHRAILQVRVKETRIVDQPSIDIQEREAWRDANPAEAERLLIDALGNGGTE